MTVYNWRIRSTGSWHWLCFERSAT